MRSRLGTPLAALAASVAALLAAEAGHSQLGCSLCKPAASSAFLWAALSAGAARSPHGRAILAALGLSWLGDVFLLGQSEALFLLGLGSFLMAHIFFAAAFVWRGISFTHAAGAALALALPGRAVLLWVWPDVSPPLQGPVVAYIAVISVMLACAAGAAGAGGLPRPGLTVAGAALFFLSDVCVAAERFKGGGVQSKLLGLPLYYCAQALLGCSVGLERGLGDH